MADENEPGNDVENMAPARRRGVFARFLGSKDGKLLGVGVAAVLLFLLIRHFGQQGAAQVAAATGDAPIVPPVPDPIGGLSGLGGFGGFDGSGGIVPPGPQPLPFTGDGGGGAGGLAPVTSASPANGAGGGGGLGLIVAAVTRVAQQGVQAVTQAVPQRGTYPAPVPIGHGYGTPINSALAASQLAHRGLIHTTVTRGPVVTTNPPPVVPMPQQHTLMPAHIASTQHTIAQTQHQAASLRLRAGHGVQFN